MISRIEGLTILNSGGIVSRSYRGLGLRRTATIQERDEVTTNQPTNQRRNDTIDRNVLLSL